MFAPTNTCAVYLIIACDASRKTVGLKVCLRTQKHGKLASCNRHAVEFEMRESNSGSKDNRTLAVPHSLAYNRVAATWHGHMGTEGYDVRWHGAF